MMCKKTHGNAIGILLTNALGLSLALLWREDTVIRLDHAATDTDNSPKGCSSLNLERIVGARSK